MRRLIALCLLALPAPTTTHYITVAGLGGEPDYEQRFGGWASDLEKALKASPESQLETLKGPQATRQNIQNLFARLAKGVTAEDALVVMLIGHGTHDGTDYKINLPGPDLTAVDLAMWLDRVPAKRQLIVNMTSASGGAIGSLAKPGRVVITATKSGSERNATVFARYWIEALRDAAADTDKNGAVSALEAFRYADTKTSKFYETQKRLATEHPLLDDQGRGEGVRTPSPDNGYGLGAAAFTVVRLGTASAGLNDPAKRGLLERKEQLEQEVDRLKYQKAAMPFEEYRRRLGALLLELAKTQEELDK
ncbi:MAG: hypothetical protein ACKV22_05360 [Bryobacteraceae bacterium]